MATAGRSTESFRTDVSSTIRIEVAGSARRNRSDRPSAAYRPCRGRPARIARPGPNRRRRAPRFRSGAIPRRPRRRIRFCYIFGLSFSDQLRRSTICEDTGGFIPAFTALLKIDPCSERSLISACRATAGCATAITSNPAPRAQRQPRYALNPFYRHGGVENAGNFTRLLYRINTAFPTSLPLWACRPRPQRRPIIFFLFR